MADADGRIPRDREIEREDALWDVSVTLYMTIANRFLPFPCFFFSPFCPCPCPFVPLTVGCL